MTGEECEVLPDRRLLCQLNLHAEVPWWCRTKDRGPTQRDLGPQRRFSTDAVSVGQTPSLDAWETVTAGATPGFPNWDLTGRPQGGRGSVHRQKTGSP